MSLFDNFINSRRIGDAIHDRRERDGEFNGGYERNLWIKKTRGKASPKQKKEEKVVVQ